MKIRVALTSVLMLALFTSIPGLLPLQAAVIGPVAGSCAYDRVCVRSCAFPDPDCGYNPCKDKPEFGCYYVYSAQDGCCYTNNYGCQDICY